MLKCCICGDVFDIGYEMPNGDCVCATHECCYEYCKCEGKRITQESEAKTMTNKPISFKEAYMTTIKKSGSAHNLTAQQPTGCVLKTLPVYHEEIDYTRPPVKGGRISITTVLGRICITLSFLAFIGSAGRVDTDPHISIATLGLMLVFSASLAGIGAMLINWRKFS